MGDGKNLAHDGGVPEPCEARAAEGRDCPAFFKVALVSLEARKATTWEKVSRAKYEDVLLDADGERVLGFEKVPSISMLMQEKRDAQVFATFGK